MSFKDIQINILPKFVYLKWFYWGIFALLIRYLTPPQYIEAFYSQNLFLAVRWLFDHSLALLPMPLLLLFYGLAFCFVVKFLIFIFSKKYPARQRLTEGVINLLNFIGFLLFWFFVLWGFNYGRPNFAKQIGLNIEHLDTTALRQELDMAALDAIAARDSLTKQPLLGSFDLKNDFESNIRNDVSHFLNKHHFPAGGNLRGRQIAPDGLLFRFGIAGIYMPFIGESSIDNGLYPLEKSFSMAHEMAHGYGWTEEATANFVAYLACRESDDLLTRYSGMLSYYRYVASNYRRQFPKEYKTFREKLPEGIKNDLTAINKRIERYPNWFDTSNLNDLYLKSQGITEGVESYSRIVVLVYSWRLQKDKK